jgi:hypothetical protein
MTRSAGDGQNESSSCSTSVESIHRVAKGLQSYLVLRDVSLVPRIRNAWSYTSTPQYTFMAWCSFKKINHKNNFTFYLYSAREYVSYTDT